MFGLVLKGAVICAGLTRVPRPVWGRTGNAGSFGALGTVGSTFEMTVFVLRLEETAWLGVGLMLDNLGGGASTSLNLETSSKARSTRSKRSGTISGISGSSVEQVNTRVCECKKYVFIGMENR